MNKNQLSICKKYFCEKCNFSCSCLSIWKKHTETELHKTGKRKKRCDCKMPFVCEQCKYETKNSITFKKHILNEHSAKDTRENEFKYYCKYCDFGTFSNDTFNLHNETKKHKKFIMRNNHILNYDNT